MQLPATRYIQKARHPNPTIKSWLTDRDLEILSAIHKYRALDSSQVARLLFDTTTDVSSTRARYRLSFLSRAGYLACIPRPNFHPTQTKRGHIYRLTIHGARLLGREQGKPLTAYDYFRSAPDGRIYTAASYPFLEHQVTLADIRVGTERAATKTNCTLATWRDDLDLRRARNWDEVIVESKTGKQVSMRLTPDGYFTLQTPKGSVGHFFIEGDRGTETIADRWRVKIEGYKALLASGVFHQHYQVGDNELAFRVLITTPSNWRSQNIKVATERFGSPDLARLFLITTLDLFNTSPNVLTSAIWWRGGMAAPVAIL